MSVFEKCITYMEFYYYSTDFQMDNSFIISCVHLCSQEVLERERVSIIFSYSYDIDIKSIQSSN